MVSENKILNNKMRYTILLLLLLPIFSIAQINESDTVKLKASASITGFYQSGNVETKIFRTKTNFSYKPFDNWVFKNQNSYVFQEFGLAKADEDILSLNFLYFNTNKKVYPFILGFVSTNFRREINLRTLTGGGATFVLLNDKEDHWLKFSVSSEYEQTKFGETDFNEDDYDGRSTIRTLRGTLWANGKYTLLKDKMILTHESYYQPSLLESNNYRWEADIGLQFPIWKYVDFKVDYRQTSESVVIENQKREDCFLTFGLLLKNF